MTTRTSKKTVTFRRPFVLDGFDEVQPPGVYNVETDEELLEGISFPAYRRISVVIHLHARSDRPGILETLTVDPNALDAALERDRAPGGIPADTDTRQKTLKGPTKPSQVETDCQALDRAEDEGMTVHPGQTIAAPRGANKRLHRGR